MTDYRTATKELQNEVLNVVTKSQTAVIDVIQTWASAVQAITPDLPGLSLPYADKLPRPEAERPAPLIICILSLDPGTSQGDMVRIVTTEPMKR